MLTLTRCDGKPTLMLRGRCWPPHLALARLLRIRALELNQSRGWQGTDLKLLTQLPQLTCLKVGSMKLENLNGLSSQPHLRTLSLEVSDRCTGTIDWRQMASLRKLTVPGKMLSNLHAVMPQIEELYAYTSCGRDEARILGHFPNLRSLRLNFPHLVDLHPLATPHLQSLVLRQATKLRTLHGTEQLPSIEHLTLEGCTALESIASLSTLHQLKELHLVGCHALPSLAFLRSLPQLRLLTFPSTRILDGDVASLAAFPSLRDVDFDDRKEYNGKREEILRSLRKRREATAHSPA